MRRREVLAGVVAGAFTAASGATGAQTPRRVRVGWLSGGATDMGETLSGLLKQTLRELGWVPGDTVEFEERVADGDATRLPRLAAELVATHPQVIACTGGTEAAALRSATATIPIVFMQISSDPVASGLVQSIARPGGNVTGVLQAAQLLSGKRLDLMTELSGRAPRRVAYVLNPRSANHLAFWADASQAASKIGAEIVRADLAGPAELAPLFHSFAGRDAVLVAHDFLLVGLRREMAELASHGRLPVMYENRDHVAAGGLVSYGADLRESYQLGAVYVDRILKGAHPRDLPVVQGSRLELVLNTGAAKAIGLTIPPSLLARADEVIE
jgi:putative tryptophan/tyrosine transport system substrate-binding protein